MSGLAETISKTQDEEQQEFIAKQPRDAGYTGENCPTCSRVRVYYCNDGKKRCEKCDYES